MTADNSAIELSQASAPTARSLGQRRTDGLKRLGTSHHMWLATGSDGYGAHLIPVAYIWNTKTLTSATFERSRTAANLRATRRARVAVGDTADLIMIDVTASLIPVDAIDPDSAERFAKVSHDPRTMPGLVYIRLVPQRMQVWNGFHEFTGRTVMTDCQWLDHPID